MTTQTPLGAVALTFDAKVTITLVPKPDGEYGYEVFEGTYVIDSFQTEDPGTVLTPQGWADLTYDAIPIDDLITVIKDEGELAFVKKA